MMPLIKDPHRRQWKNRVYSQCPRHGKVMGYSMRTKRYRYTEWVHFVDKPFYRPYWEISYGTELYDLKKDPGETRNKAGDLDYKSTEKILRKQLHRGWRSVPFGVPNYF